MLEWVNSLQVCRESMTNFICEGIRFDIDQWWSYMNWLCPHPRFILNFYMMWEKWDMDILDHEGKWLFMCVCVYVCCSCESKSHQNLWLYTSNFLTHAFFLPSVKMWLSPMIVKPPQSHKTVSPISLFYLYKFLRLE